MENIRHNVFETNSSSTHSISISGNSDATLQTITPDDNGVIHLKGRSFGWENDEYNQARVKAIYAFIDTEYNATSREMLIEVIKEHTGAKEVQFDLDDGYIDHQSQGTTYDAFVSKEVLKNWLFNPESSLTTGNDNDGYDTTDYDYSF